MRLYGYWRSTATWRVRIGLALKGLSFETVPMDLRLDAQRAPGWLARNPQGLVPALELDDGRLLTQSLAILEWLEEVHPRPALLPSDPVGRARVRAAALVIVADTHPIQNLGVLRRVEALAGADAAREWACETIAHGLAAFEQLIDGSQPFCFGEGPGLADVLLVPMLGNARRFGVDVDRLPRCLAVEASCARVPAFAAARPEVQPDAG